MLGCAPLHTSRGVNIPQSLYGGLRRNCLMIVRPSRLIYGAVPRPMKTNYVARWLRPPPLSLGLSQTAPLTRAQPEPPRPARAQPTPLAGAQQPPCAQAQPPLSWKLSRPLSLSLGFSRPLSWGLSRLLSRAQPPPLTGPAAPLLRVWVCLKFMPRKHTNSIKHSIFQNDLKSS